MSVQEQENEEPKGEENVTEDQVEEQKPEVYREDSEVRTVGGDVIISGMKEAAKELEGFSGTQEELEDFLRDNPHLLALYRLNGLTLLNQGDIEKIQNNKTKPSDGYDIGSDGNNIKIKNDKGEYVRILSITKVEGNTFTCKVEGSSTPLERSRTEVSNAQLLGNRDYILASPMFSAAERRVLGEYVAAQDPEMTDEQKRASQIPLDDKGDVLDAAREKAEARLATLSGKAPELDVDTEKLKGQVNRILAQEAEAIKRDIEENGHKMDKTRLAEMWKQYRALKFASDADGDLGMAYKRAALGQLKHRQGATDLYHDKKFMQAAEQSEAALQNLLAEHLDGEALERAKQIVEHGDLSELLQLAQSKEFESMRPGMEDITKRIFGKELNPEKITEMLKSAGYNDKEISKMMIALEKGGIGLFGLIALIVGGIVYVNAEAMKKVAA